MKILNWLKSDFRQNYFFYFLALTYGIIFSAIKIVHDDIINMSSQFIHGKSVLGIVYQGYFTWSSRVLINTIMYYTEIISSHCILLFGFITGILVLLLSKSLNSVFNEFDNLYIKLAIIVCILMYPFSILSSAGWVATIATYFWPFVFMSISIMSLVQVLNKKKLALTQKIMSIISIIYAANNEQITVILIFVYTIFFVVFLFEKKLNKFFIIQYMLIIISLLFIITTPGNVARSHSELANWFPSFITLNSLSKFQLGYTSTMYKIIFNPNCLIIVFTMLVAIIVNTNSKSLFVKIISVFPSVLCLVFGPLQIVFTNLFPNLIYLNHPVSESNLIYGLITENNYADKSIFLEYLVLGIFLLTLFFGVYFSFNSKNERILSLSLLVGGLLSRISIGFSPTIWASGDRTFSPLYGCIFLICIILMKNLFSDCSFKKQNKTSIIILSMLFGSFNFLSLLIQILVQ
ncbi:MAG: hypothetical protein ABF536_01665 [Liquorilactobacillus mali]|uniref:hypothetical protein n=1 Tax=Liquorilactobacillus mali TaxID=1618 RepID=UPI0039ECD4D2